jgi:uncharacterized protein YeaO (DUF488 family)
MARIELKRAYEAPSASDGHGVLVDRVWPCGVSRVRLRIDLWAKDLAPSTELRRWFGHDPAKWSEFQVRYFDELDRQGEAIGTLSELSAQATVTLVFGAKDQDHNNAVALKTYLERRAKRR